MPRVENSKLILCEWGKWMNDRCSECDVWNTAREEPFPAEHTFLTNKPDICEFWQVFLSRHRVYFIVRAFFLFRFRGLELTFSFRKRFCYFSRKFWILFLVNKNNFFFSFFITIFPRQRLFLHEITSKYDIRLLSEKKIK